MPECRKDFKIAVINLGSSSTKIAYFIGDDCVFRENLHHDYAYISSFHSVWEQYDFRSKAIEQTLNDHGVTIEELDAIVSRGGETHPVPGGVYHINEAMISDVTSGLYGCHATDVGVKIAFDFGQRGPVAMTANTPSTDEFSPLARYSGLAQIPRRSSFHALNHKAAADRYAREHGLRYEDLNLVVIHMGGGISVAAHEKGRMIDGPNALDGDGPFSTDRCGAVPTGSLASLCFSGEYTESEIRKLLNGKGGLVSYVGESDCLAIEKRAADGDEKCREVLEAMCYQVAKEIGAQSTVLCGKVDAIVFTGGMSHSSYLIEQITKRTDYIAPHFVYPGEFEVESLHRNVFSALRGEKEIIEFGKD